MTTTTTTTPSPPNPDTNDVNSVRAPHPHPSTLSAEPENLLPHPSPPAKQEKEQGGGGVNSNNSGTIPSGESHSLGGIDDTVDNRGDTNSKDSKGENVGLAADDAAPADAAAAAASSANSFSSREIPAEGEAVVVCVPTTATAASLKDDASPPAIEEAKLVSKVADNGRIPQDDNEEKKHKGGNDRQNVNRSASVTSLPRDTSDPTTTDSNAAKAAVPQEDSAVSAETNHADTQDSTKHAPNATSGIKNDGIVLIPSIHSEAVEKEDSTPSGDVDNESNSKREKEAVRPLPSDGSVSKYNSANTKDETPTNEVTVSSQNGAKGEPRGDGEESNNFSSAVLFEDDIIKKKNAEGGVMETNESSESSDADDVPMNDATGLTSAKSAPTQVVAMDGDRGDLTTTTKMGRFHPKRPKRLSLPSSSPTSEMGDTFKPNASGKEDPKKEESGSEVSIVESNNINTESSSPPTVIISPQEYHLRFCLLRRRRQITKDMRKLLMKIPPAGSYGAAAATSSATMGGSSNASDASTIRSDAATVPRSNRANGLTGVKFPTPTSLNSNPSSGDASSISRSQGSMGRDLPMPFQDSRDGQQLQRQDSSTSGSGGQVLRSQHESARGRYCGAATQGLEGGRRRSSAWDSLSLDNASAGGGSGSGGSFPMDSISPAPFKVVMTKEYLDKISGCTPVDDRGSNNRGKPEAWERIMSTMMAANNSREDRGLQGIGREDMGRQAFSELTTPSSTIKRAIDEVFNSEYDKNSGISSLLRKRSIEHVLQGGSGDAGMNSHPSKSPLPKKSFLQRERIMDEVMRNHMKEALEDLQNSHHSFGSQLPSNMSSHFSTPGELKNQLPHADIKSLMLPLSSDLSLQCNNDNSNDNNKSSIGTKEVSRSTSFKKTKKSQEASDTPVLTTRPIPEKPRRPFSAYNLFFQLEREFIMNELNEGRKPTEDPLIKRAMLKLEEGLLGADEENEEGTAEVFVETESTNSKKDEDGGKAETDDLIATDPHDNDGVDLTGNETTSTDLKEDDDESKPVNEPASTLTKPEDNDVDAPKQESDSKFFDDPEIPPRYRHIRLDKYWYSVSHKQKRKHRKTEGSCSFMELTTMVSARWKIIEKTDPHVKKYCQKLALMELNKYKGEIAAYKSAIKAAEKDGDALRQQSKEASNKSTPGLKKKGRKNKKVDAEDRSSPPDPEPRATEIGRGRHSVDDVAAGMMMGEMDMNRFMEFARMSNSLKGSLHAHLGNSPYGSSGGSGGLPPPPFADDERVRIAAEARMNNRARLAAELAEARMAEARVAAGMSYGRDPVNEAAMMEAIALAEARSYGALPDDRRMLHPREAQSRMSVDAFGYDQSAPSSIQRKFAALAEAEARHRMQLEIQADKLGHRNMGAGGWSKYSDGLNLPRNEFDVYSAASNMARMSHGSGMPYSDHFLGQSSFPPHGDTRSSSLQRKFMELAGMSDGRIPSNLPNSGSHNFETEVEHFLSTLGQEIRRNRQKFMDVPDESGMASANYGMAGMGESSRGGMRMDDPMGMRAEMLKQMMMGGSNTGGSSTSNTGGNTSPRAMAEMLMMRKRVAESSSNNFGNAMSGQSYHGSETPTQRGASGGGGHKGGREGDDDNPSLPEYGWSQNSSR